MSTDVYLTLPCLLTRSYYSDSKILLYSLLYVWITSDNWLGLFFIVSVEYRIPYIKQQGIKYIKPMAYTYPHINAYTHTTNNMRMYKCMDTYNTLDYT